jgi:hypothetical protein
MEQKYTAVDWLVEQLPLIQQEGLRDVFEEAKFQEKQQIMNAWYNGFEENRPYVDHSEDYYNDTYKQQDNKI